MAAVAGFFPRGDGKPYKQIEKLLMRTGATDGRGAGSASALA